MLPSFLAYIILFERKKVKKALYIPKKYFHIIPFGIIIFFGYSDNATEQEKIPTTVANSTGG
jgi:hypothetical protein